MEAAKKLVTKNSNTSTVSPIKLPDTTGSKILDILDVEKKCNYLFSKITRKYNCLLQQILITNDIHYFPKL